MWCPRLDHFVRFNPNGTVSSCGHMANAYQFDNLEEMRSSAWISDLKEKFAHGIWPSECIRCRETEEINSTSIRLNAIKLHDTRTQDDYLQVAGILDNVCNSACQFCNEYLSTKIGSLQSTKYIKVDNSSRYWNLPLDKIEHLDINGGEPSASKNYRAILKKLPPNLKTLRVNTNCSLIIPELKEIQQSGIEVTLTVSFDGIENVHNYVRWPIPWDKFYKNLMEYKEFGLHDVNLWTTVNVLNINDIPNILSFVNEHSFNHSYALLKHPVVMDVKYVNTFTTAAKHLLATSESEELRRLSEFVAIDVDNTTELMQYMTQQDSTRGINSSNFI